MQIKHQFLQAQIATLLMENLEYDFITGTSNYEEIILRKKVNGTIHFVRLSRKQHDWQREMERTLRHVENTLMNHFPSPLFTKNVHFHHLYFVDYEPVDSYEHLYKTESFHKKVNQSHLYILTKETIQSELQKFENQINFKLIDRITFPEDQISVLHMEQLTLDLQRRIHTLKETKHKQSRELFHYGKPILTFLLIAINILIFIFIEYKGSSTSTETLIKYGAKYNIAIMDGEYWRFITSMFLHIGTFHLLLNMLALYFLGTLTERIFGNSRYFLIYMIAGLTGGLASFAFNPAVAAGASGAIYGLFGALLYFGWRNKEVFMKTIGMNVFTILGINIIFGFIAPQIDVGGHLGGLVGGFIAAMAVGLPNAKSVSKRLIGWLVCVVGLGSLFLYGVNNEAVQKSNIMQLQRIQNYMKQEEFEKIIPVASDALENTDENEFVAELLFYRSYAYIQSQQVDEAIADLEIAVKESPEFEEAWYNLAILYQGENEREKAIAAVERLLEIDQDNDRYEELLQLLRKE
ncbi:rhomboid protease GluP [Gracilibacillus halotolerans]|uniref:Rhomboid protease GluP n=1 Tax=Gracilibacillus halotolerans TaxID=74386 RepID=A0A841RM42_9BACI|nr:rhomboid family intramembrane serine protease [Gracilibacillus halotolerans]MBB6511788.1 rhomboid protease GluP [Gracilibacillus halotolerans]